MESSEIKKNTRRKKELSSVLPHMLANTWCLLEKTFIHLDYSKTLYSK